MTRAIVLNEDLDVHFVRTALRREGIDSIGVREGRKGFQLIRRHQPDLVICDASLLDANGARLFRRMKETPETADIPFVLMSSSPDPSPRKQRVREHAEAVLEKPFTLEALAAAVRSALSET